MQRLGITVHDLPIRFFENDYEEDDKVQELEEEEVIEAHAPPRVLARVNEENAAALDIRKAPSHCIIEKRLVLGVEVCQTNP